MSVRQGLLALLSQKSMYGAELRTEFEARTGSTWPINIGQIYTTLGRLERDELVEQIGSEVEGRREYALTATGRDEVAAWWASAETLTADPRDELTIKLAMAVTMPDVDVAALVQRQRSAALAHLQALTTTKRTTTLDLAAELVLERRIFDADALVRWLDHVEGRLTSSRTHGGHP